MNMEYGLKESEQGILKSKEEMAIKKLLTTFENKGVDLNTLDNIEETVLSFKRLCPPGTDIGKVILQLKELKKTQTPPPEKIQKVEPEKEHYDTEIPQLEGVKTVIDPELQKIAEENKFFEELKIIFRSDEELEIVLNRALALVKENSIEDESHYYAFAEANLIEGGREEVDRDLKSLIDRKEFFKKREELLDPKERHRIEKAKKIATIVEAGIAYCVTKLGWYGDNVSIEKVAEFNDVKRGIDDILQIKREKGDVFLGLGIDVTYRGLLSKEYKEKLYTLLQSIQDGHKTKIKYFKDHNGKMMKEFLVAKIILFFDTKDVKSIVKIIKDIDNPNNNEEIKKSYLKNDVLSQIIIQCEMLSKFAKESENNISYKYDEVVSGIKRLGEKNEEVQKMLDERHEDDVSKHMNYLLEEFKQINKI